MTFVVVDPEDYAGVLGAKSRKLVGVDAETRRRTLAQIAFARTAAYDLAVSNWLAEHAAKDEPPRRRTPLSGRLRQALRYGENPHQQAAFYATGWRSRFGVATAQQLQGKELSYNNINDTDAAYECVAGIRFQARPRLRHRQARQPVRRHWAQNIARRL